MAKKEKLLWKIRHNPNNVSFEELKTLLFHYGFELKRSSGSHHSFSRKIGGRIVLLVVPYRRPVKVKYVKNALALIEQIEQEDQDE